MPTTGGNKAIAKTVAVIQSGGPTAVLNGSLFGLLQEVAKADGMTKIVGVRQGLAGLTSGDFCELDMRQSFEWLPFQPGAALGAGRMALTEEDLGRGVEHLRRADIHAAVLLGGNGTMAAGSKLTAMAKHMGYELQVIGIPKTVDNDITGTDHTPGFPSAAQFVARAVRDLTTDLAAMKNFEQVRIIETMGRNVGWLTAASAYYKETPEDGPHLVYVPEATFDPESMLSAVADIQSDLGYCVVVVSEGLKMSDNRAIMLNGVKMKSGFKSLGGVGGVLAEAVSERPGLACRYESLGILQRCASFAVSALDRTEAIALGAKAAQLLMQGESGWMVSVHRLSNEPYHFEIRRIAFDEVAGRERELDGKYIVSPGTIDPSYAHWLSPFMDTVWRYESLIPAAPKIREESSS